MRNTQTPWLLLQAWQTGPQTSRCGIMAVTVSWALPSPGHGAMCFNRLLLLGTILLHPGRKELSFSKELRPRERPCRETYGGFHCGSSYLWCCISKISQYGLWHTDNQQVVATVVIFVFLRSVWMCSAVRFPLATWKPNPASLCSCSRAQTSLLCWILRHKCPLFLHLPYALSDLIMWSLAGN